MSKKQKTVTLEGIDREIALLQESMMTKAHGEDSTKSIQKLSELYVKRRRLFGEQQ